MKDAVPLEQVAAHIHTLMTGDAAERLEQLVAVLLLSRERCRIAAEPTVEPAPGGQQRPLIGCDRIQKARAVRPMPIGLAKLPGHRGISAQLPDDLCDSCPHGFGIFQRRLGLRLERPTSHLPTEPKAE